MHKLESVRNSNLLLITKNITCHLDDFAVLSDY